MLDGDLQNLEDTSTRHTHVNTALKDKIASLKSQLTGMATDQESLTRERSQLKDQIEQLALQAATAEERFRTEASARRGLQDDLQRAVDREDAKSRELKITIEKLQTRESDLKKFDDAVRTNKAQSSDRVVLEIEIDRLRRDAKRAERDAEDARQEASEASMQSAAQVSFHLK